MISEADTVRPEFSLDSLGIPKKLRGTLNNIIETIHGDGNKIALNKVEVHAITPGHWGDAALINMQATHEVRKRGVLPEPEAPVNGIVELRGKPEERKTIVIQGANGKKYVVLAHAASVITDAPISLDDVSFNDALEVCQRTLKDYRLEQTLDRVLYTSPGGSTNQVHMVTQQAIPKEGKQFVPEWKIRKLSNRIRTHGYQLMELQEAIAEVDDMATFTQIAEFLTYDELKRALNLRDTRYKQKHAKEENIIEVPAGFFLPSSDAKDIDLDELRTEPAMIKLYNLLMAQGYEGAQVAAVVKKPDLKHPGKMEFLFASVNSFKKGALIVNQPLLVRRDAVSGSAEAGDDIFTVLQARLATGKNEFEETVAGMFEREDYILLQEQLQAGNDDLVQETLTKVVLKRLMSEFGEETGLNPERLGDLRMLYPVITNLFASATASPEAVHLGTLSWENAVSKGLDPTELSQYQQGEDGSHEAIGLQINSFYDPIIARAEDLKTYLLTRLQQKAKTIAVISN